MSLRINTNIDALTSYRNLSSTQNSQSTSIERLSSGLRINHAADDAAGLAISQGLTAQINGTDQAMRNAQDGINMIQTADSQLGKTQDILQKMRTLSVQAANDSNDSKARADINTQLKQLTSDLDRIANKTTFNNVSLLSGTGGASGDGKFVFHVGYSANDTLTADLSGIGSGGYDAAALGVSASSVTVDTQAHAELAIKALDKAIQSVSTSRAKLGSLQNSLQNSIDSLSVAKTNLQSSNSSIQDADMAQEMSNYTRTQILSQAGTSMLKQANQAAQSVMSLLQ
jgi:flagellin